MTATTEQDLSRELRQAARRREALADAHARRAKHYRAEAAEMRTAAVQITRRLKRSEAEVTRPR